MEGNGNGSVDNRRERLVATLRTPQVVCLLAAALLVGLGASTGEFGETWRNGTTL